MSVPPCRFHFHSRYMMSSNLLGRGALSVMMLMYSGECTSTVQNVWSISADHKDVSARALRVYRVVQAPFTVFFSVSRVLVGPCFLYFVVKARARAAPTSSHVLRNGRPSRRGSAPAALFR